MSQTFLLVYRWYGSTIPEWNSNQNHQCGHCSSKTRTQHKVQKLTEVQLVASAYKPLLHLSLSHYYSSPFSLIVSLSPFHCLSFSFILSPCLSFFSLSLSCFHFLSVALPFSSLIFSFTCISLLFPASLCPSLVLVCDMLALKMCYLSGSLLTFLFWF